MEIDVREINVAAASLARRIADRFAAQDGRPRFVAGSIGPSGFLPSASDPTLGNVKFEGDFMEIKGQLDYFGMDEREAGPGDEQQSDEPAITQGGVVKGKKSDFK